MNYTSIKKTTQLLILLAFLSSKTYSQDHSNTKFINDKITKYIEKVTQKFEIPGAALAVIKNGVVIYKNYSGKANVEYNVPISKKSLFRLHSLSKIFVSTKIFQMIEKGEVSLEDSIVKYLSDLPENWKNIKIKNLLTHSSGLPEIAVMKNTTEEHAMNAVFKKPIRFSKGKMSDYNQTNFWLLNRIIRVISKENFNQSVLKHQFNLDKDKVTFSSVTQIVPNRISEYKPDRKGNLKNFYFDVPKYMYGAAGLTISLDEFVEWNKKFDANQLVNANSKKEIFTPFKYDTGKGFTKGGWDEQNINEYKSYGFNGGGLVNFRKYPEQNLTIIWLTNGYRIPYNIDAVTNEIAGIIFSELKDKTPEVAKFIERSFSLKTEKEAILDYKNSKKKNPYVNFQHVLNGLGYSFLGDGKTEKAIFIFKLNAEENPDSANAFDSLAEAYFEAKKYDLSIQNYKKAIALGGTRGNAKMMLSKIKALKEK